MGIALRRTDSRVLAFQRKSGGNVILDKAEEVFFTVKEHYRDTEHVLQKKLSDGGIVFDSETGWYQIPISAEDTKDLDFKTYYFDVKAIINGKEKYLMPMGTLEIVAVVTGLMKGV